MRENTDGQQYGTLAAVKAPHSSKALWGSCMLRAVDEWNAVLNGAKHSAKMHGADNNGKNTVEGENVGMAMVGKV